MPVITCYNKEFVVPYDKENITSEYIKDIVTFSGDVDVVIPVQDKYCTVINNYVEFLTGERQSPITNRDRLLLSFQLNTLFVDSKYFSYLTQQVFNNWSYMCNMVYNELNDDLQWLFFIHSPYDFIPKYLLDNDLFTTQWNKANHNTIIQVNNDNETYYNNIETTNGKYKVITTYHTVNSKSETQLGKEKSHVKEVGYKKITTYYKDSNNIASDQHYVDGKKDGILREWYDNDQHTLRFEDHYVDGKKDGILREWYDNDQHTLSSECHYVDGKEDGTWRWWYDDDQHTLRSEKHYVDGKENGLWRYYYDNDQHTLGSEGHYVDSRKHGLYRIWYNNDQHTLESEQHYVDGKPDGVWRWWYDNDQHTLETEGYWVNGKKHGRWVEFDINGVVTSDDVYVNDVKQY